MPCVCISGNFIAVSFRVNNHRIVGCPFGKVKECQICHNTYLNCTQKARNGMETGLQLQLQPSGNGGRPDPPKPKPARTLLLARQPFKYLSFRIFAAHLKPTHEEGALTKKAIGSKCSTHTNSQAYPLCLGLARNWFVMQPILLRFIAIALTQNSKAKAIATDLHIQRILASSAIITCSNYTGFGVKSFNKITLWRR